MTGRTLIWTAASALLGTPVAAADMLVLQRTVPPDEPAPVVLLIDRGRVATTRLQQMGQSDYAVEITLVGNPNISVKVTCQNLPSARQVLDALRGASEAVLDVSGRCRF